MPQNSSTPSNISLIFCSLVIRSLDGCSEYSSSIRAMSTIRRWFSNVCSILYSLLFLYSSSVGRLFQIQSGIRIHTMAKNTAVMVICFLFQLGIWCLVERNLNRCGRKKAKNGYFSRCKLLIISMRDFQKMPFCARI